MQHCYEFAESIEIKAFFAFQECCGCCDKLFEPLAPPSEGASPGRCGAVTAAEAPDHLTRDQLFSLWTAMRKYDII